MKYIPITWLYIGCYLEALLGVIVGILISKYWGIGKGEKGK